MIPNCGAAGSETQRGLAAEHVVMVVEHGATSKEERG
jgi:hypothetical protein